MKTLVGALFLSLCFVGTAAYAQNYGAAGCGLGSLVFSPNSGQFMQVFAATTNGTFGSQTFGITTGTSNCAGSHKPLVAAKAFIQTNRETLAKDMSRGNGETIATLSKIAGCKNSKVVGNVLQTNFNKVFTSATISDVTVSDNIIKVLATDKNLSCKKIATKETTVAMKTKK